MPGAGSVSYRSFAASSRRSAQCAKGCGNVGLVGSAQRDPERRGDGLVKAQRFDLWLDRIDRKVPPKAIWISTAFRLGSAVPAEPCPAPGCEINACTAVAIG